MRTITGFANTIVLKILFMSLFGMFSSPSSAKFQHQVSQHFAIAIATDPELMAKAPTTLQLQQSAKIYVRLRSFLRCQSSQTWTIFSSVIGGCRILVVGFSNKKSSSIGCKIHPLDLGLYGFRAQQPVANQFCHPLSSTT